MTPRPRVLLLAESANPDWSSVSLVGWSLARALRDHVEAHLVTQVRNRDAIERAGWRDGREFTAIDSDRVARPVDRFVDVVQKATGLGWTFRTALSTLSYDFFERLVWRRFGQDIARGRYDVVHRITPVSPTIPSPIARRCDAVGVPFVWGPLNGGVPWPRQFRDVLRSEGEWLSYVREAHRWLPGYAATRRAAAATLTGSVSVWQQMKDYQESCVYLPENAVDLERFSAARSPRAGGPLRAAFVGRLVPYKGADMLLEAAAPLVRAGRVVVDVIGDGPQMPALRRQVDEAGIANGVALEGWIDHRRLAERLVRSDVFAFPSVREFGGGVVLEAMALGLPPIVVDYAGPSELVTEDTGFRVPLGSRAFVVEGFRAILAALAERPERAREVGERACRRVHRLYTWDVKARQVLEIYRWVLGRRGKPDFGMPLAERPGAGTASG